MAIPDSTAKPDRLILEPPKQRNLMPLWIVLSVLCGLLLGGGGIYLWQAPAAKAEQDAAVSNAKTELQTRINELISQNAVLEASLADAQKQGAAVTTDITFEEKYDEDSKKTSFSILRDGTKVGAVELNGMYQAEIFKQTARNAYIGFRVTGDEGFEPPFPYWAPEQVYRLQFATNQFTPILVSAGASDFALASSGLDISPDESRIAFIATSSTNRNVLIVRAIDNAETIPTRSFGIPDRYDGRAGDLHFSPNGKQVALGASMSSDDTGAIFVASLDTEKLAQVDKEQTNGEVHVDGWMDNRTPLWWVDVLPLDRL